jgi:transcriptional regulator with XRE-family HTH domain
MQATMTDTRIRKLLAANMRRAMVSRGWTQTELSDASGEPAMNISRILNEKNTPKVGTVQRLAQALGVGVDDLLQPAEKNSRQSA